MSVPGSMVGAMMEELIDTDSGTYRIRTATGSHYLLDLDGRTLTRLRAAVEMAPDYAGMEPAELRRDGEQLDLHRVITCRVGERAVFVIQLREDPSAVTVRDTSEVQAIVALSGPPEGS